MTDAEEHPSTTLFRDYIRINTMQPNPDYPACVNFLRGVADSMGLKSQVSGKLISNHWGLGAFHQPDAFKLTIVEREEARKRESEIDCKEQLGDCTQKTPKNQLWWYLKKNCLHFWPRRWPNAWLGSRCLWWPGLDKNPPCLRSCSTHTQMLFQVSESNMWELVTWLLWILSLQFFRSTGRTRPSLPIKMRRETSMAVELRFLGTNHMSQQYCKKSNIVWNSLFLV